MALFLYRIRRSSKLNSVSNQIARYYSQDPFASSLNYTINTSKSCLLKHQAWNYRKRPTDFCYSVRFFGAPVQTKDVNAVRLNEQITARFIRLVTDEGHGVVPIYEALAQARKLKLDLVEVQKNADPPVCKIMDFHKEKYMFDVKMKERAKSKSEVTMRKGGDCKEVRFSDKTEQKDLKIKADQIIRLMERGYRVKCMVTASKKRKALPKKVTDDENEHDETRDGEEAKELAALLSRLTTLIEDVSYIESGPKAEKSQAFVVVRHAKFGPGKKGGMKKLKDAVKSSTVPSNAPTTADEDEAAEKNEWSVGDSAKNLEEVFDFGNYLEDSVAPKEKLNSEQQPTGFNVPNFSHPRPVQGSTSTSHSQPSHEEQNRYRKNEPRNQSQPTALNNRGPNTRESSGFEPRFSTQRMQPPPNQNSTSFSVERKEMGADSLTGRNLKVPSNETFRRGPSPTPPNTQAPRGYGIFSSGNASSPARDSNTTGFGVKSNSSADGGQRPGTDQGGQQGWGIFSKEGQNSNSSRLPKSN